MEKEISKDVFNLTEDSIYIMIENLKDNPATDQILVYCFIKAFYLYTVQLYFENKKIALNFENIYFGYKENLKNYYKINNANIEVELLDQILNFFDNSFSLIQSVEFNDIDDSYEFRHYVIKIFELLRIILENNSKSKIRQNIFENYTRVLIEQKEKIFEYLDKKIT